MARGRFIVFEGGESTGKSTQAARLAARLDAVLTREPGGTALGEGLRAILLDGSLGNVDPRAELLLMVGARAQHCAELIRPTLETGTDVVCDRFSGSTIAYQGYGRGLPIDDVAAACALATAGLEPDITILLDLDVAHAATRRAAPGDAIERAGAMFHERVRAGFLAIASTDPRWVVVDGAADADAVQQRVDDALENYARVAGAR